MIWRCPTCRRTYNLALIVPQLQGALGRLLTDKELDAVPDGAWHTCPGPTPAFGDDGPKQVQTAYDWRTGQAK